MNLYLVLLITQVNGAVMPKIQSLGKMSNMMVTTFRQDALQFQKKTWKMVKERESMEGGHSIVIDGKQMSRTLEMSPTWRICFQLIEKDLCMFIC